MGTYKFSIYLLLWENTLKGSFYSEVKKKKGKQKKSLSYTMLSLLNKELNKMYYPEMFRDWKNTQSA